MLLKKTPSSSVLLCVSVVNTRVPKTGDVALGTSAKDTRYTTR